MVIRNLALCLCLLVSSAAFASAQTADAPLAEAVKLNDGPYVFLDADGGATAKWARDGKLSSRHFAPDEPIVLPEFEHLLGAELDRKAPVPSPATWPQPNSMLVLSDVEGQYASVLRFLKNNDVVNADGAWAFGDGHVVCLGDMVDRGTEVTETLWLFHRLSLEAARAGGHVHFILGNHEAMVLGGDVRYTADKYKMMAAELEMPCEDLLGADTVLGRWLRSCNCLERIGDLLFVHAGISPTFANRPLDFAMVNGVMRAALGTPKAELNASDPATAYLLWGRPGPLWYRGYFEAFTDDYGPVPSVEELDLILANTGARTIVVGHTKVSRVTSMFEGRVLAIDIPWTKPKKVRGLRFEGSALSTVDIEGKSDPFDIGRQPAGK